MNLSLSTRFSTDTHTWLCFRHAVKLAGEGQQVELEIDDFGSEYYMGPTYCSLCSQERQAR